MILITKDEIKQYLRITSTNFDNLLNSLIDRASDYILKYINNKIESQNFYELYDGDSTNILLLNYYPVLELKIVSDNIDREAKTYSSKLTDFLVNKELGKIELYDNTFTVGQKNIYIEYEAGYKTCPDLIKQILCDLVAKKFYDSEDKRFGVTSKSLMGENISFSFHDISTENKQMLNKYVKSPYSHGVGVDKYTEV